MAYTMIVDAVLHLQNHLYAASVLSGLESEPAVRFEYVVVLDRNESVRCETAADAEALVLLALKQEREKARRAAESAKSVDNASVSAAAGTSEPPQDL